MSARSDQLKSICNSIREYERTREEILNTMHKLEEENIFYKNGDRVTAFSAQGRDEVEGVVLRGWFRAETYWYLIAYDNGASSTKGLLDKQIIKEEDLVLGWKEK